MLVRDCMSSPPITITLDTSLQDALKLVFRHPCRRLPVVDKEGRLVGLVSKQDLPYASPKSGRYLSIFEQQYQLASLHVQDILTTEVVTTTPDTIVEDAARLMVDNRTNYLAVVQDNRVVGVITGTDVMHTFIRMCTDSHSGLQLTLKVPEKSSVLPDLFSAINELGGNVVGVGAFLGHDPVNRELFIKVRDGNRDELLAAIEALGDRVIDAREV